MIAAQNLLENSPEKQAEFLLQKGLIKLWDNNYQGAMSDFSKAIELNPNYAQAYYQRGRIYAQYAFGTNPNPNGLPPGCDFVNQVRVCRIDLTQDWRNKNLVNALKDLDKSLELNPNYAPIYYQKGLIFEAKKQPKEAIEFFQIAINLYSDEGLKYLATHQPKQASDFLDYSNISYHKITEIESLILNYQSPSPQQDIGGSTQSPERQKSPEELFSEACNLVKIPDYLTAVQKYRESAKLFQQRGNQKRYQETQKIVKTLEGFL